MLVPKDGGGLEAQKRLTRTLNVNDQDRDYKQVRISLFLCLFKKVASATYGSAAMESFYPGPMLKALKIQKH